MNETKSQKMNLEHERRIVALQERVERLENLCYSAKEVLNLEEASSFLGIAKSTLYKLTGSNSLPYFKPAGKLIFFVGTWSVCLKMRRSGRTARLLMPICMAMTA